MRDFDKFLDTMQDYISGWDYYVDFEKVYLNVAKVKEELEILNTLIGSKDIRNDFIKLVKEHPELLKVIPILIATRESKININTISEKHEYDFAKLNDTAEKYADFMEKIGLFDLIENHLINNLVDYVIGIEVGMDTNARKNRTGKTMEHLVEEYLVKAGFILNDTYFKQMSTRKVEEKFGVDLSKISNDEKNQKVFDFVFVYKGRVYGVECNFYSSQGSKLNETARSYKDIAISSRDIDNFTFVWFTDGKGWNSAKSNLRETYENMSTLFNLYSLKEGVLTHIDDFVDDVKKNDK